MMKLNRKGFTLVEIMIVVAIIALLAAIAIPNLLRARLNANESASIATCKTIVSAATSFASANNGAYPASLAALTGANPPYLDPTLDDTAGAPPRQGYTFLYTTAAGIFDVYADPVTDNVTGSRQFYVEEAGVVYSALNGQAAPAVHGTIPAANWTPVQ